MAKYGSEVPVGDGPCTDCGQENPYVWWTDNVFWNAVCRTPDSGPEPTLCVPCFVKRVFAAGYRPNAMRIIPDWPWQDDGRSRLMEPNQPNAGEDELNWWTTPLTKRELWWGRIAFLTGLIGGGMVGLLAGLAL